MVLRKRRVSLITAQAGGAVHSLDPFLLGRAEDLAEEEQPDDENLDEEDDLERRPQPAFADAVDDPAGLHALGPKKWAVSRRAQQSPASTTAALAVDQLEVIVVRRRARAVGPGFEAEAYERKLAPRWRPEVVLGPRILAGLDGGADAGLAEVKPGDRVLLVVD
jgi:hypothetical protein